ncbi:MAG: DUF502 domain-containing protein [Oscillatoriales cyanobacterium]|nr:MAG: DUF502 domain-containing protein [Oscillatoriales cyanobacterium]
MTQPFLERIKQDLKSDLIAGLLLIIPLATTIWLTVAISRWVIEFLTRIPKQLNPFDGFDPWLVGVLNLVVGLAVPLLSILLIGLMARNIVGRWLFDLSENIVQAIPLAGSIYKTLKQLLSTLLKDSGNKFRRVVLIEYPRPGLWVLAFVTGTIATQIQAKIDAPVLSVFVPTTPNPTTGWYAIVPEDEAIEVDVSIEDAFKILISGGIVSPTDTPSRNDTTAQRRPTLESLLAVQNTSVEVPRKDLSYGLDEAVAIEIEEDRSPV